MENTWRKIVEVVPGNLELALNALAINMGFDSNVFSGADAKVLKDAKYITAVPIELALTSDERELIMQRNPEVKYVITRVQADRVADMVDNLDYDLILAEDYMWDSSDDEDYENDIDEAVEIIDADSYYQIGNATVKGSELYEVFEEDPKVPQSDEQLIEEETQKIENSEDSCNKDSELEESYTINGKDVSREEFFDKLPEFFKEFHKLFRL